MKQERQGSVAGAVFEGVSSTDVHWGEIGIGGLSWTGGGNQHLGV